MNNQKYGIKIPIAVDDYIWVTELAEPGEFDLRPVLYDTVEEAQAAAEIWGPLAKVLIHDKDNIVS